MTDDTGSGLASASLLRRVVDVKPNELAATRASFIFFFFVLCSWFVLRPIRDLIAVTTGVTKLPWLFGGTLVVHGHTPPQQHFPLKPIPGQVAPEFVPEELAGLVPLDVRDRA